MARPNPRDMVRRGPWAKGANNVAREDSVPSSAFSNGVNVDVYPGGKLRRRPGSTHAVTQVQSHSLWSDGHYALVVSNGVLYRFVPGQALKQLATGLQLGNDVIYESVNQYIYVSDGVRALRVNTLNDSVVPWGVVTPALQPTLAATSNGGMHAGTYQLAITYARADGEEGGATASTSVDVAEGGGIALSGFAAPPADVATLQIYLTKPNDDDESLFATVPANVTSLQLYDGAFGRSLTTQYLVPMPAGIDAVQTMGRLFVAVGPYLIWSEPLQFGLYNPEFNYVAYSSDITLLAATGIGAQSPGLFVATESRTYFETGSEPKEFMHNIAYNASAVPGSRTIVSGSYFDPTDGVPNVPVPVWVSSIGTVCVGMPDGSVKPLTEGRFAMSIGDRGAAVVRELNGIRQVLFSMRPPTATSRLAAQDTLTVTRMKNGITVS